MENFKEKSKDELIKEIVKLKKQISNFDKELKESKEKYKAVYNCVPFSYQSLNEAGSIKDVNPVWLRTFGYDREEVIGNRFEDFLHSDWKSHFEKNFIEFKQSGHMDNVQFKIRHKDGHYLDILSEGCISYYSDGNFKQTYCVLQDITERKQVEQALQQSEELYRTMIEHSNDMIWTLDTKGNFLYINKKSEDVAGKSTKSGIGESFAPLIVEEDFKMVEKVFMETLKGKSQNYEVRINDYTGTKIITLSVNTTPLKRNGKVIGTVSFGRDITKSKQTEKELNKHREHLKDLVKLRTAELEEKNKELEEFNELFIGRELRIKELRDRVKELERKL